MDKEEESKAIPTFERTQEEKKCYSIHHFRRETMNDVATKTCYFLKGFWIVIIKISLLQLLESTHNCLLF